MKLLAVDVGNTNIKYSAITDGVIGEIVSVPTKDLDAAVSAIVSCKLPVGLSSVRRGVAEAISSALKADGGKLLVDINWHIDKPVFGFYEGMGADRIADMVAAWTEYGRKYPVAVLGLGTGTTISAVTADGKFCGGLTTLGLGPICKTLTEAIPALPPIDPLEGLAAEPSFDVYSALCRGTVAAHVGVIEKWVSLFKKQLGEELVVAATGGWSKLLTPLTNCVDHVDPLLTIKGIGLIANDYS